MVLAQGALERFHLPLNAANTEQEFLFVFGGVCHPYTIGQYSTETKTSMGGGADAPNVVPSWCSRTHKIPRNAKRIKAGLLPVFAPRSHPSGGATALLRGCELSNDRFARVPDLFRRGYGRHHSFPDRGDGPRDQPAGSLWRSGFRSSCGSPQHRAPRASCRLAIPRSAPISHFTVVVRYSHRDARGVIP